jgi:hypothetical protein
MTLRNHSSLGSIPHKHAHGPTVPGESRQTNQWVTISANVHTCMIAVSIHNNLGEGGE